MPEKKILNDSGVSEGEARKLLESDGVDITYGEMRMRVQSHMVKEAKAAIAQSTPEERQQIRLSVIKALDAFVKLVPSCQFTKEQADNFIKGHVRATRAQQHE